MSATKYVPKAVREAYEMGMRAGRKEVNTEMLEALKEMVDYYEAYNPITDKRIEPYIAKVKQAITKAEGKE
jgi:hypothetical protein